MIGGAIVTPCSRVNTVCQSVSSYDAAYEKCGGEHSMRLEPLPSPIVTSPMGVSTFQVFYSNNQHIICIFFVGIVFYMVLYKVINYLHG